MKVRIYSSEDDGWQFVYINDVLNMVLHFNDDQLGESTFMLLKNLNIDFKELGHDSLNKEQIKEIEEAGYEIDYEGEEE